jgi:hypothetical protein
MKVYEMFARFADGQYVIRPSFSFLAYSDPSKIAWSRLLDIDRIVSIDVLLDLDACLGRMERMLAFLADHALLTIVPSSVQLFVATVGRYGEVIVAVHEELFGDQDDPKEHSSAAIMDRIAAYRADIKQRIEFLEKELDPEVEKDVLQLLGHIGIGKETGKTEI